jgi:hypothetical protein
MEIMPKLYYQGHGSFRLTANDGRVIYVDPYKDKGYDVQADKTEKRIPCPNCGSLELENVLKGAPGYIKSVKTPNCPNSRVCSTGCRHAG